MAASLREPIDLVWLRFTVGAFFLTPILLRRANRPPRVAWLGTAILMAACQGAPLALLLAVGLYYAPAAHASALAPGVMPLFAAALGLILLGERLDARRAAGLGLIVAGAAALAGIGAAAGPPDRPFGHALFMAAALLGAMYTVLLRRSGLPALQGLTLVTLYSAAACLPLPLLLTAASASPARPPRS